MSGWNFEGMRVHGSYLGEVAVSGVVKLSRVSYGGTVNHHIVLDKGFSICGGKIHREAGETIIIEHPTVTRVESA